MMRIIRKMMKILAVVFMVAGLFTPAFAEEIDEDPQKGRASGNASAEFYGSYHSSGFGRASTLTVGFPESSGLVHSISATAGATIRYGVDVAEFQGRIDWNKAKADGVEFAIVRVGYRGYQSGKVYLDSKFREYITGAKAAGIKVGVYVFSQAVTTAEAVEEAKLVINNIGAYNIDLPIMIDREHGEGKRDDGSYGAVGRLYEANLSKQEETNIVLAFGKTCADAGYDAGIYASASWLQYKMYASQVTSKYTVWVAHWADKANLYTGKYTFWQYRGDNDNVISGMNGGTDLNVWYDDGTIYNTKRYADDSAPKVEYRSHIQNVGWETSWKVNGETTGSVGSSRRLEAIRMITDSDTLGIEYKTMIQNIGWESSWRSDGAVSGTEGRGLRLEAIRVRLTGEDADKYSVWYRAHVQNYGWLDWTCDGQAAGSQGMAYRMEALDVVILPKGETPSSYAGGSAFKRASSHLISYQTHVQNIGWQSARYDGELSGTEGRSLRLEGIKMSLTDPLYSGGLQYKTHVQSIGWESGWTENNKLSGTSGRGLRLEAVRIRLYGEMAEQYDVYYQTHVQNKGWTGWAKNGQECGSEGYGLRLEGIRIRLVKKGDPAPGSEENPFWDATV